MVLKICTNLKNFFHLEITNKHWWKSYLLGGGGGGGGAPLDGGGGGGVALGGGPLARFPLGFPEAFVLPEAEGEKEYCQVKSKSYNSFLNNWTKQMQIITGVRSIQWSNLMISFTDPEVKITSRSRGTLKYFSDLGPHGLKSPPPPDVPPPSLPKNYFCTQRQLLSRFPLQTKSSNKTINFRFPHQMDTQGRTCTETINWFFGNLSKEFWKLSEKFVYCFK